MRRRPPLTRLRPSSASSSLRRRQHCEPRVSRLAPQPLTFSVRRRPAQVDYSAVEQAHNQVEDTRDLLQHEAGVAHGVILPTLAITQLSLSSYSTLCQAVVATPSDAVPQVDSLCTPSYSAQLSSSDACVCVCVTCGGSRRRCGAAPGKETPAAEVARTEPQTPQQTEGSPTVPRTPYTGQNVCQSSPALGREKKTPKAPGTSSSRCAV